jgi:hypothetical protein
MLAQEKYVHVCQNYASKITVVSLPFDLCLLQMNKI